jgi:hypothetical protein
MNYSMIILPSHAAGDRLIYVRLYRPRLREINLGFVRGVCGKRIFFPTTTLGAGNLRNAPAPSVVNSLQL